MGNYEVCLVSQTLVAEPNSYYEIKSPTERGAGQCTRAPPLLAKPLKMAVVADTTVRPAYSTYPAWRR